MLVRAARFRHRRWIAACVLVGSLVFVASAFAVQYFSGTLTYPHAVVPSNTYSVSSQVTKNSGARCAAALYTPPSVGVQTCATGGTVTISAYSATGRSPAYQATCDITNYGGTSGNVNLTCRYFNGF